MERLSLGTGMTAAMSQGSRVGGHGHVDALGGPDGVGIAALVEGAHVVGPDARGVDHDPGPDGNSEVSSSGTGRTTAPSAFPSAPVVRRTTGRVVGHHGAELEGRRAGHGEGQPGVVGPGVEVEEPGHQVVGVERRAGAPAPRLS